MGWSRGGYSIQPPGRLPPSTPRALEGARPCNSWLKMGYIRDSSPSAMIEAAYEHHHINARYLNCGYSEARGRLSAPEIFKDFPDRDALATSIFCSCVTNTLRTTRTPILRPYPARSLTDPQSPTRWRRLYRPHFMWRALTGTTTKSCSISCGELFNTPKSK
jgi:hypothetical protein